MGHRGNLAAEFRSEGRAEFAFLVEEAGFSGPYETANGLLFRRARLIVEVWYLDGHEPGVSTLVAQVVDGRRSRGVSLDDLYVAGGCGPAQDVPFSAQSRRATLKRVRQHAAALYRLLPQLLDDEGERLIARCRG
ncbi:hypothetical protein SAMN04487980_105622 [Streptomyces sp. cf124]|uniref:hypothetical protein n=1 Tax=Streptomyces sp. cf124 TaxID=1761903 RepID=UPI0008E9553F|nr:hypothetical protein [Streptomyces sp. cf124]SFO08259.1 hypothetical protein SAMN04487980_105622 [Streptomyces sp. cf124]